MTVRSLAARVSDLARCSSHQHIQQSTSRRCVPRRGQGTYCKRPTRSAAGHAASWAPTADSATSPTGRRESSLRRPQVGSGALAKDANAESNSWLYVNMSHPAWVLGPPPIGLGDPRSLPDHGCGGPALPPGAPCGGAGSRTAENARRLLAWLTGSRPAGDRAGPVRMKLVWEGFRGHWSRRITDGGRLPVPLRKLTPVVRNPYEGLYPRGSCHTVTAITRVPHPRSNR